MFSYGKSFFVAIITAAVFACLIAVFAGLSASAACSPRVYVYGGGTSISKAARADTKAMASAQISELCSYYGYNYDRPVRIVLTNGDAGFEREAGEGAPYWATAIAKRRTVVVRRAGATFGSPQFESTLKHELSHVVLAEMFARRPEALPHWLNEGLAMHVSGEWEMPEAWVAGKTELFAALRNGEALDFEEITGSFPAAEWKARIAYAQSFHFTDYMLRRFGQKEVVSLLHRLADGDKFDKAFASATGEDFYDTERYWRDKVAGRGGFALLLVGVQQFDTWLWLLMALLVVVAFVRYMFKRRSGGGSSSGGRVGYFDDEWDDPPDILDEWDDDSMGNRPWRPGSRE